MPSPAFSHRLPWSARLNPLAAALAARRAAGLPVLDLTVSNPTAAGLRWPARELYTGMVRGPLWRYTPDPLGLPATRAAIARYYAAHRVAVTPEQLCLTSSTSEAYAHLFRLLADPGENFLVPRPSYPLFADLATLAGVELRPYDLGFDGAWYLDCAALAAAADGATRGIIVVAPNNPTGSYLKRDEVAHLREFTAARGLALLVDEVFADYPLDMPPTAVPTLAGETAMPCCVLSGLSKVCALPQMKLAWIAVAGPPAWRQEALARLEQMADAYLSVASPIQQAAPYWLARRALVQEPLRRRLRRNLVLLRRRLADTPVQVLPVEGGWYAMLRLPRVQTDEQWALALLAEHGLYLHPGYFFDCPIEACLVISLLTPTRVLAQGAARLGEATKNL